MLSGRLIRRDPTSRKAPARPGATAPAPDALGSRAGRSAGDTSAPRDRRRAQGSATGSGTGDPELDEIEAILRRRGIT